MKTVLNIVTSIDDIGVDKWKKISKNHGVLCIHQKFSHTWLWRYCILQLIRQQETMYSRKKIFVGNPTVCLAWSGFNTHRCWLMSAKGRIAQTRDIFGVTDSSHSPCSTPSHSSSPFTQQRDQLPIRRLLDRKTCCREQLWIRGGKEELCSQVIIPCRV